MEDMDKGLTVPKWVLINRGKYPKCLKICLPSPNIWNFDEKRFHRASLVRVFSYGRRIQPTFQVWSTTFNLPNFLPTLPTVKCMPSACLLHVTMN